MLDFPQELISALEGVLGNPWMILFLATWVIGFMLKEHTEKFPNDLIPWVLFPFGIVLGWILIESSIGGMVVGGIIGALQMVTYELWKPIKRLVDNKE